MNQIYRGGCQCGAVLYEVELDAATATPCGSVWQRAALPGTFRLLTGDEQLRGVQFSAAAVHHFYCDRCGELTFAQCPAEGTLAQYMVDLRALVGLCVGPRMPMEARSLG